MPAIGMRLWAEERRSGTIELLITLPVTNTQLVVGKFLASWFFTLIALILTMPIWITVNFLGDPDNNVILISYIGSWFMAGAFFGPYFLSISTYKKSSHSFYNIFYKWFYTYNGWFQFGFISCKVMVTKLDYRNY